MIFSRIYIYINGKLGWTSDNCWQLSSHTYNQMNWWILVKDIAPGTKYIFIQTSTRNELNENGHRHRSYFRRRCSLFVLYNWHNQVRADDVLGEVEKFKGISYNVDEKEAQYGVEETKEEHGELMKQREHTKRNWFLLNHLNIHFNSWLNDLFSIKRAFKVSNVAYEKKTYQLKSNLFERFLLLSK